MAHFINKPTLIVPVVMINIIKLLEIQAVVRVQKYKKPHVVLAYLLNIYLYIYLQNRIGYFSWKGPTIRDIVQMLPEH